MTLTTGKHTPPFINRDIHIARQRLIHHLKAADTLNKHILYIEAQAGQGKSTLISQYLNEKKAPFVWYQIDPEDNAGAGFIQSLYQGLTSGFDGFQSGLLAEMIDKHEITSGDFPLYSKILVEALQSTIKTTCYLVFDDLYLLEKESPAAFLVESLVKAGIKDLHIILISRSRVGLNLPGDIVSDGRTVFSDKDLAMTKSEIADFLSQMTTISVTADLVNRLYESTEGWTMGILTMAHTLLSSGDLSFVHDGGKPEWKNLKSYFKSEVLRHLSDTTVTDLSKLSYLSVVPLDLAVKITGNPGIRDVLDDLVVKNYFTRYAGFDRTDVTFHHLFQESLNEYARERLSEKEIASLFEITAHWYLENNRPENGIAAFIKAGNFSAADQALKRIGLDLFARNAVFALLKTLMKIPEQTLKDYSWLSFFFGLAMSDQNPPEALAYFKLSKKLFTQENDRIGLLLSCSQLVHFHVWGDSMFSEGEKYLPTIEALFTELSESLPVQVRIHSLYCLTCGYTVFGNDFRIAERYGNQALTLSMQHGFDNLTAMIRFINCYLYAFTGNLNSFAAELETLSRMASTGRICSHNLLLIYLARLLYLEMKGDFLNFRVMREHLKRTTENNLAVKSILLPFIMLWDLDMAIAEGDYEKARALGRTALELPGAGEAPHFTSQFLHFKAYAEALSGHFDTARTDACAARSSRKNAGSPFFIMHTDIVAGGALARAGCHDMAEPLLTKAVETSDAIGGSPERKAMALAHLVSMEKDLEKTDPRRVHELIDIMHDNKYQYLLVLSPELFRKILEIAFSLDIRKDFVRSLSMKRLGVSFSEHGDLVPALSIKTLGNFYFEKEGRVILKARDFTATQLRLLSMLISSRHGYLNVEDIIATFWPEKTVAKGRASFDTMISRLRKVLASAVAPQPVSDYFTLKKEQLRLENTLVDVDHFIESAEAGMKHADKKQFFQAENEFRRAFTLFDGTDFMPGIVPDQASHTFKEYYLRPLISDSTGTWSRIMLESPEYIAEDMELLERMITADSGNIELVRNLHQLKCRNESNLSAGRLIKKYKETLRVEGFFADEIEEMVESIWEP